MAHFGIFCFPGAGHLNPMLALGRELQRRGHEVTVFQIADVENAVRSAGLRFVQIGRTAFPPASLRKLDEELSRQKGVSVMRATLERINATARMVLEDGPDAVRGAGVDVLLVDQAEIAAGSVAHYLGIPFLNVICHPPVNASDQVPPIFFGWGFRPGVWARLRNRLGHRLLERLARSAIETVNHQRALWGLEPFGCTNEFYSEIGQIAQIPKEFDFPRGDSLPQLFYTGPFVDESARPHVQFPWERLDGRPLIYASMGTLQNGFADVFRTIAVACSGFNAQLVLALGGQLDPASLGSLPGNPVAVRYAPQLELLRRSVLCITHAGMNTTLEALASGVPMVAIPVGNDQPGVAARIACSGTGTVVPLRRLSPERLRKAIHAVLTTPSYRHAAGKMRDVIQQTNGLQKAADLVIELSARSGVRNLYSAVGPSLVQVGQF